jgi:sigma-B regulation protein RsbU (phosphoserine phosphatase)
MTDETPESLRRSVAGLTEELVNVYEELALLHSLGPRLSRLDTEESIAAEAVAAALESVASDCCWVAVWDQDELRLPSPAVRGIVPAAARHITETALAPLHFRAKPAVLSHSWIEEHHLDHPQAPERFLAASLASAGHSLGYLCVGRRPGGRIFVSSDQKLLCAVASLVAVAMENVRLRSAELEKARLEGELELARAVQRSLLPRGLACHDFLAADALSIPCQQVGGDYLDLLPAGADDCLLVMADVFGKGPAAALQAQLLQGLVHGAARHTNCVREVLGTINAFLRERTAPGSFVTAFVATLHRSGRLHYVNAGHNPPLWIRPSAVQPLTEGGPLLGVLEHPVYQEGVIDLHPGDLLLLYTDGVSEEVNERGENFGDARVLAWAARQGGVSPVGLPASLLRAVEEFSGGRPNADDVALLAVRFIGGGA